MSNKPKPKKSFTPNYGGALYPTTEEQRAWFDRHRFDVLLPMEGEESAKFEPEKLKYLLSDEAGMRPDPDLVDGIEDPIVEDPEMDAMLDQLYPGLDDRIHEEWLRLQELAKRKKP